MKRCLLGLFLLMLGLSGVGLATEETATIGIGGNAPLKVGEAAQVLISHASYPRLEDFTVSASYAGKPPESLGHPNDNGILSWTPSRAGEVRLAASAPAIKGHAAVALERSFSVSGEEPGFPRWYHLLGIALGILLGLLLRPLLLKRMAQKARKA